MESARLKSYLDRSQIMVEKWVAAKGIANPRVLSAMRQVPRHLFVPESLRSHAYSDSALPIGFDQTISQPYIVALMTQALLQEMPQCKRVLEIGTGSGYQAAILAELGFFVFSIERIHGLMIQAREKLDLLGYSNVSIKKGDGSLGWKELAPFDGIMVTAAAESLPQSLLDQLEVGGVMVIPLVESGVQVLYSIQKHAKSISKKFLCYCRFVPFVHS